MLQTIIKINDPMMVVNDETFKKYHELRDSLPKDTTSAKSFNGGSLIKLYHDQETDSIGVILIVADLNGDMNKPCEFARISPEFTITGLNVLGFHFTAPQGLTLMENEYHYNDYYGFYKLMNELLEDNIFKIR